MRKFLFLAAVFAAQPALADEANPMSGPRIELRASYVDQNAPLASSTVDFATAFTLGAELGYDLPIGRNVTVGPYVTYDYAHSERAEGVAIFRLRGRFAAGGRTGINLGSDTQFYGKLGYLESSQESDCTTCLIVSRYKTHGLTFGAGVDQTISGRVYLGIEYNHASVKRTGSPKAPADQVAIKAGMRF